ncbi:hypothetical protein [Lysinibacillus fusiformis]|uniref:hypothetical protein n=1 Tax=Lysinibacillus fusiformis TaxID=28031 RepID=UPI003CFC1ED8
MNEMPSTHQKRLAIDERICALLCQRKELSAHTKDSPTDEMMKEWAQKYGLNDTFLAMIFSVIKSEKYYQSRVEPVDFVNIFRYYNRRKWEIESIRFPMYANTKMQVSYSF